MSSKLVFDVLPANWHCVGVSIGSFFRPIQCSVACCVSVDIVLVRCTPAPMCTGPIGKGIESVTERCNRGNCALASLSCKWIGWDDFWTRRGPAHPLLLRGSSRAVRVELFVNCMLHVPAFSCRVAGLIWAPYVVPGM